MSTELIVTENTPVEVHARKRFPAIERGTLAVERAMVIRRKLLPRLHLPAEEARREGQTR